LRIIAITFGCFAVFGGTISVGLSIFGKGIVTILLGKDYLLAGVYLSAIAPLFFLKALSQTGSMMLVIVDMQKQRTIPQAVGVVIKTISDILVLPIWQVLGIIWTYIFSELAMLFGYLILGYRWFQKRRMQNKKITSPI